MSISSKDNLKELFDYEKNASRTELFVRIIYTIPISIILCIYSVIAGICQILQWLTILIVGRRLTIVNNFISGYLRYYTHTIGYICLTTDRRPGIMPQQVAIYEKKIYYENDTAEIICNYEDDM